MQLTSRWLFVLALAAGACAHHTPSVAPVTGRVVLVAGGPQMKDPFGVALDRGGSLFIVEEEANRVLRKRDGRIEVYAGTGVKGDAGDGGPALAAALNNPHHVAFAPGNLDDLIIADTLNGRVRRIDHRSGVISTIAGSGKGFGGDGGAATQAQFANVFCLAFDRAGTKMYLADLGNRRVRSVDLRTGVTATEAGNGDKGVPRDGADARQAPLLDPRAIAVDGQGNLYIAERNGHALRVVDRTGKIRTVVGTGEKGFSGDGGPARAATLNGPKHLAVDAEDNVLIVDTENHAIRKYLPREGLIVRVAGSGVKGSEGVGGPPESVELDRPHGAFVDEAGVVYISDSGNHRVLKVER
jgi:DNA-binding beta-propeller fold protein YncE